LRQAGIHDTKMMKLLAVQRIPDRPLLRTMMTASAACALPW
jgi:hypothetical protein